MPVLTTVDEGVGLLVLDWPGSKNALTMDTVVEVAAAVRRLGADETVCGVVVTGNGAFCSGFNLHGVGQNGTDTGGGTRQASIENQAQEVVRALVEIPVPTVAALDGAAVGMGFDIALACDSRLFGPRGWGMQGWGRIGLVPGTGGELLLRRLHPSIVWRLLETQPRIDGPDAERWGIGETVTDMTAREAAVRRVRAFAALSRDAVAGYVSLFRAELRAALPGHLRECAATQDRLLDDPALPQRIERLIGAGAKAARREGER